jgi:hypothetical protein
VDGLRGSRIQSAEEQVAESVPHLDRHLDGLHLAREPAAPVVGPEIGTAGSAFRQMALEELDGVFVERGLEVVEEEADEIAAGQRTVPGCGARGALAESLWARL